MKKILLLILLISLSIAIGYSWKKGHEQKVEEASAPKPKTAILRFALVADSHSENVFLQKALSQAKGMGVNFVIGLGDWSTVGTIDQLTAARKIFDESKLPYYLTTGDHDLWDSRNQGKEALANFNEVFGKSSQIFDRQNVLFVILDNSDIYIGIIS